MGGARTLRALICAMVLTTVSVFSSLTFIQTCQALTVSYGRPYQGRLDNGVVFPDQFPGYHLRDESRSYTTPEVVGALLDAIEAVRTQFPGTCDLFIADFTCAGGGSAIHHRSHQNGRDVDIGMYAEGNRPLNSLVPMNKDNLDAAKTWCLIENLIASQRVQYIFLDRSVQKVLYEYALTRGYDQAYLEHVFGNVRGCLIQHIRNHIDHMHVRFFTPWSTLAAHIGADELEKQAVIEMAQQSYLPRKVNYYVNGSEKGLDQLANSFGVTTGDLCRWNHISPTGVLVPGSCLVFYKRSFESEPVLLARSLQPGFIAQAMPVRMASLQPEAVPSSSISDSTSSQNAELVVKEQQSQRPITPTSTFRTYKARKGDTLDKIARRNKLDVKLLCRLNGINKTAPLKPGQRVKTGAVKIYAVAGKTATDASPSDSSSSSAGFSSNPQQSGSATAAYFTMKRDGTLQDVSKKTGIPVSSLCRLNGLGQDTHLKPGQKIKLAQADLENETNTHKRGRSSSSICFASDSKKPDSPTAAYYTVNNGGTLQDVSKKTGISISSLCQLNGLARNARLKPGQRIKLTQANLRVKPSFGSAACSVKGSSKKPAAVKQDKSDNKSSKHLDAKAASANKTIYKKPAVKKTGKSGKPAPATVQKKTPGSGAKLKTAAKPGKNTALAKR
ncbi:MAG TPA: LysM peptidoglycan-binding domain-containing protein [Deltaproteobacteria bacterium]|nr:LysM peptidoglycan-binding domain-containing protein [Deltaproteobacteria bacterium]HIJ76846.1 LysM peptidoglycan-binding domain-containing protein [Deltaproteobacteria bacterium]